MKIFKYQISGVRERPKIPHGYKLLKVGIQNGYVHVWCLVDESNHPYAPTFYIIGTGEEISEDLVGMVDYIDTVFNGPFVWHVFIESSKS